MPCGGCIFWYIQIYLYKYDYVMDFNLLVMLRSTMGPYGRPVIEVAYEKMILSLHRDCMGDDSLRRVVGVSTWCIAYVWHTRVNTSVGSLYIIFWFSIYKNLCICILFSKAICSIKEHWWSLTLSWSDEDQRMFSIAHEFFHVKLKPKTNLWWLYTNVITFTLWHFIEIMSCLIKNSLPSQSYGICIYLSLSFF